MIVAADQLPTVKRPSRPVVVFSALFGGSHVEREGSEVEVDVHSESLRRAESAGGCGK